MLDVRSKMKKVPQIRIPEALRMLIDTNIWGHPGEERIREVVPFIHDPLDFLPDEERIYSISRCCLAGNFEVEDHTFHVYRGSQVESPRDLPWLDVELRHFLAVNRIPGDDVAIAIDYRSSHPRVVGSFWGPQGCEWLQICDDFEKFAIAIGMPQLWTEQEGADRPPTAPESKAP